MPGHVDIMGDYGMPSGQAIMACRLAYGANRAHAAALSIFHVVGRATRPLLTRTRAPQYMVATPMRMGARRIKMHQKAGAAGGGEGGGDESFGGGAVG